MTITRKQKRFTDQRVGILTEILQVLNSQKEGGGLCSDVQVVSCCLLLHVLFGKASFRVVSTANKD